MIPVHAFPGVMAAHGPSYPACAGRRNPAKGAGYASSCVIPCARCRVPIAFPDKPHVAVLERIRCTARLMESLPAIGYVDEGLVTPIRAARPWFELRAHAAGVDIDVRATRGGPVLAHQDDVHEDAVLPTLLNLLKRVPPHAAPAP